MNSSDGSTESSATGDIRLRFRFVAMLEVDESRKPQIARTAHVQYGAIVRDVAEPSRLPVSSIIITTLQPMSSLLACQLELAMRRVSTCQRR